MCPKSKNRKNHKKKSAARSQQMKNRRIKMQTEFVNKIQQMQQDMQNKALENSQNENLQVVESDMVSPDLINNEQITC
jgi:hypothetical protein